MMEHIRKELSSPELLAALAEEAAELAQAALKLRRALDGADPTPKSPEECRAALKEELSDVSVICDVLGLQPDPEIKERKLRRWINRLFLKENFK